MQVATEIDRASTSPGAVRVRRSRERKRNGLKFVPVEVRASEREALIRLRYLDQNDSEDAAKIAEALYRFFEDRL